MLSRIGWLIFGFLSLLLLVYLFVPSTTFPKPLPDSPQSKEPGDVLDLNVKRAYFTDNDRERVTSFYRNQFQIPALQFIKPIRLNYPPEEAEWHIYPHTRSSYLEEYVFPLRESIFVNGYQPGPKDDQIVFEGQPYQSKVTVKYNRAGVLERLGIGLMVIVSCGAMILAIGNQLNRLIKRIRS